jgi:hypothetical protein
MGDARHAVVLPLSQERRRHQRVKMILTGRFMREDLGPPADEEHAIDSTIVRAHQHAAGVKGEIKIGRRSGVRGAASRPNSTSAPTPKATR